MEDFLKQFKDILRLSEVERQADIKGHLLSKIANGVKYRRLSDQQSDEVDKIFLPVYQALREIYKDKS